jgi:choline kinase
MEHRMMALDRLPILRLALAADGLEIGLVATDDLPWCEIDTPEDLEKATAMFSQEKPGEREAR